MSPLFRSRTEGAARAIAAAVALGALLAGCSDIYYDRRETIALGADDAVAANAITQMVDPWPPSSGNRNIAFNGERMQRAVHCYRLGKVAQPIDMNAAMSTSTTSTGNGAGASAAAAAGCETQPSGQGYGQTTSTGIGTGTGTGTGYAAGGTPGPTASAK